MKMSELIAAYGDENIEFQNLDSAIDKMDYHHKRGTKITFGTTMDIHHEKGTEKLGLVIWLDREKVRQIMEREKSNG